jgi:hypothetical protein
MGLGRSHHLLKVPFISLFIFPTAAATPTTITQIVYAGYTMCGKLRCIGTIGDIVSPSGHVQFSCRVSCYCSLVGNAQILHFAEVVCAVGEWRSCPQTTKCFYLIHQWRHLQAGVLCGSGCDRPCFFFIV